MSRLLYGNTQEEYSTQGLELRMGFPRDSLLSLILKCKWLLGSLTHSPCRGFTQMDGYFSTVFCLLPEGAEQEHRLKHECCKEDRCDVGIR